MVTNKNTGESKDQEIFAAGGFFRLSQKYGAMRKTLTHSERDVYECLMSGIFYGSTDGFIKKNYGQIKSWTGIKKNQTVSDAILGLVKKGLIRNIKFAFDGENGYYMNIEPKEVNADLVLQMIKKGAARSEAKRNSIANGEKGKFKKKSLVVPSEGTTQNRSNDDEDLNHDTFNGTTIVPPEGTTVVPANGTQAVLPEGTLIKHEESIKHYLRTPSLPLARGATPLLENDLSSSSFEKDEQELETLEDKRQYFRKQMNMPQEEPIASPEYVKKVLNDLRNKLEDEPTVPIDQLPSLEEMLHSIQEMTDRTELLELCARSNRESIDARTKQKKEYFGEIFKACHWRVNALDKAQSALNV